MSSHKSSIAQFKYQPVSNTTIRVFEIQISQSQLLPCCIQGHLKHTSLEDAPPFLGLSYSWGSQPHDVPLICNGLVLYVTASLANAISKLQILWETEAYHQGYANLQKRYIWADQICINQQDSTERSHQVKLMGKIYSRAIRTVVWLGPDLTPGQGAWHLIDKIYHVFQKEHQDIRSLAEISLQTYSPARHIGHGLPPWDDPTWKDLQALLSLPWFSRTWVIQEVVLSPLDPVMIHGDSLHSFDKLGCVASWLRRKGYLRQRQVPWHLKNVDTIANIRRSPVKWSIDVLLMSTSAKFQATDQRDKIFGLLGLAQDTQDLATCPAALQADYNLNVAEVYRKVALYLFRQSESLVSLTRCISSVASAKRFCAESIQSQYLPSWVPNWSDISNSEEVKVGNLVWIDYSTSGAAPTLKFPNHYRASKGLPLICWTTCGSRLSVRALCVDTVDEVWPFRLGESFKSGRNSSPSSTRAISTTTISHSDQICQYWQMATSILEDRANTEEFARSFIRTLTANQFWLGGIDQDQMYKDGASYLFEKLGEGLAEPTTRANYPSLLARIGEGGNSKSFEELAHVFLTKRAFLLTRHGRLGLGPEETQPGDLVYIIPGGDVPYVATKRIADDDEARCVSKFVGESWIDGLMSGEAVESWNEGALQEEILELY